MVKRVILWILTISCMVTIFAFSNQRAVESKKTSSEFIKNVVKIVVKDEISEEELNKIAEDMTFIARKGAHFCIYALLGFLVTLLLKTYRLNQSKTAVMSALWVFVYSLSDELHQYFIPGRSMQLSDVCLDCAGGFFGVLAAFVLVWIVKVIISMKGRKRNEL